MFDWIGSLRIKERSSDRVVLALSRSTEVLGWGLLWLGAYLVYQTWQVSPVLALLPAVIVGFGSLLATLRRRLIIDRAAGVLRVEQRVLGFANKQVVPLFHLRAVVVMAQPRQPILSIPSTGPAGVEFKGQAGRSHFIAYLERRIGKSIFLDEAPRCKTLLELAEAIAEVAELRLEYDAAASSE